MKKKFIYFVALGAFLTACGTVEVDKDLEDLNNKRDSLKVELAIVNANIALKDTTVEVLIPIVTASKTKVEDFMHSVQIPGTVETDKNAIINAESSGVIKQISIKEGQRVSKGQTLMVIDSEILASTMNELETSLELADYMFKKQEALRDQGVGVEIQYEQAKNQKLGLEQKIKTLRSQKGKTIVRAPFSGVIDDIFVNQGEMAAPQIPLLRIVNNDEVTVVASMSESLLSKINVGSPVEMSFPALDTSITSVVSNKGNYIDPTNRTFRIQIEIKNNKILLPNQFAELQVTDFTRKNAIVIDGESILQDTDNNNYVYRLTPTSGEEMTFEVEKIFVTVIKKFEGNACIEGAINDGDLLVVKGAKGITEEDQVKVQK